MSAIQRYVYNPGNVVVGGQNIVNLNYLANPFHATILVNVVRGEAVYGVDFTHDDLDGDPSSLHWINDTDVIANGQTKTKLFRINASVTGLRLNLQLITGEVRFSVIQGVGLL